MRTRLGCPPWALLGPIVFTTLTVGPYASATKTVDASRGRWQQSEVTIFVDPSLAWIGPGAFAAAQAAAAAWQQSDLNVPSIIVEPLLDPHPDPHQNLIRFAPAGAPEAGRGLAITIGSSDPATESIVNAQIVINGKYHFATLDRGQAQPGSGPYDLQNVLTHEFGHFLGLGENRVNPEATMYVESGRGETEKRDLAPIDVQQISALYPEAPDSNSANCSASGRPSGGGFKGWLAATLGILSVLGERRGRVQRRAQSN